VGAACTEIDIIIAALLQQIEVGLQIHVPVIEIAVYPETTAYSGADPGNRKGVE
jgi:hypothetical protein